MNSDLWTPAVKSLYWKSLTQYSEIKFTILHKDKTCILFIIFLAQHLTTSDNRFPCNFGGCKIQNSGLELKILNITEYKTKYKTQATEDKR